MIGMSANAGTLLGGGLGAGLGQLGEALSLPRRALWEMVGGAFGVPEESLQTGADLLGYLGMDPESPWTQALGMGAEIVGDPLTYGGGLLGRAGSLLARGGLTDDIARLTAQRAAAQQGLVRGAGAGEMALAGQAGHFDDIGRAVDLDSLARGDISRTFARPGPGVVDAVEQAHIGRGLPDGGVEITSGMRPDFSIRGRGGRLSPLQDRGKVPEFLQTHPGASANTLTMRPGITAPQVSPEEMALLRRESVRAIQGEGHGLPFASIHNPVSQQDVLARAAGQMAPPVPMPAVGGMPADVLFGQTQTQLAEALARLQQYDRQAALLDQMLTMGGIGGATGVGLGLGAYLGGGA